MSFTGGFQRSIRVIVFGDIRQEFRSVFWNVVFQMTDTKDMKELVF